MKNIVRFIDLHDQYTGVLVDMEYEYNDVVEVKGLKVHSIDNGTIGKSVEVNVVIRAVFETYLIKFLEHNK